MLPLSERVGDPIKSRRHYPTYSIGRRYRSLSIAFCPVAWSIVDSSPQVMLLAIDFHKDFINEEGIAITSVLTLQSSSV